MTSVELLHEAYEWLPVLFALDLLLFHLVADHPLAVRWWWGRSEGVRTTHGLA